MVAHRPADHRRAGRGPVAAPSAAGVGPHGGDHRRHRFGRDRPDEAAGLVDDPDPDLVRAWLEGEDGVDPDEAELQIDGRVGAGDSVVRYAIGLGRATRPREPEAPGFIREWVTWGAGPRAGQYLILGAKARAALHGLPAARIEDVRAVAKPVLRHRIITNFNAEAQGVTADQVVERLLEQFPNPTD